MTPSVIYCSLFIRSHVMDETWFPVPTQPMLEITRSGRVKAKATPVVRTSRWGKLATYRFRELELRHGNQHGYPVVRSRRTGKVGPIYVHRLMALTFVDGFQEGLQVNHINGVKNDFRPENLEWVPLERNVCHAWETGLTGAYGEDNKNCVLSWKKVEAIRRAIRVGATAGTIATIAGVNRSTIEKIADGRSWSDILRPESSMP